MIAAIRSLVAYPRRRARRRAELLSYYRWLVTLKRTPASF